MKKKLVAIISTVAMLVTMIPATAFAQETTSLPGAVDGVITLTENVTLSEPITIGEGEYKNVTALKLNGHKLKAKQIIVKSKLTISDTENGQIVATGEEDYLLVVNENASLTINGGTLQNTGKRVINNNGTVTLESGTISGDYGIRNSAKDSSGNVVAGNVICNVNGGEIKDFTYGICVFGEGIHDDGSVNNDKVVLNITGGNIANEGSCIGISANASSGKYAGFTINMTDGTINTGNEGCGIYLPGIGSTNISGGEISGLQGIRIAAGDLDITGGTITGTAALTEGADLANGGSGGIEGAIVVGKAGNGYVGDVNINIGNGAVISNTSGKENNPAIVVSDKNMGNSSMGYDNTHINVNVTDANVDGDVIKVSNRTPATSTEDGGNTELTLTGTKVTGDVKNATTDGNLLIVDTTVTGEVVNDSTEGKIAMLGTSNASKGTSGSNIITEENLKEHEAYNVSTFKDYKTIEDAIKEANAGDEIMITADEVAIDSMLTIDKDITLNLNGKVLKSSDSFTPETIGDASHILNIAAGGVTVENGTIITNSRVKSGIHVYHVTNVTLRNLNIDHTGSTEGAAIIVNGSTVNAEGNINIKTDANSWHGINVDPASETNAEFKVAPGAIVTLEGTNTDNAVIKVECKGDDKTASVVNDGTINGNILATGKGSNVDNNGTIVGKVNTQNGATLDNTDGTINDPTTPSNPGGTVVTPSVTKDRLAGADRFETAVKVADQLKKELGVSKFNNVVVTYSDEFADALSATALAADKDAPILLINKNDTATAKDYISKNLAKNGTVYIIGGTTVVPEDFAKSLTDCKVVRLGGADRYETNMEVLKELKVDSNADIMVASGLKFADALSASATGNPILLVGKTLTTAQKDYIATLGGNDDYYVIGGTAAINATVENQLKASRVGDVARLAGDDRYETSAKVADAFSAKARALVIASGADFPDGLTGGVLASAKNAPLMLVADGYTDYAADFVDDNRVRKVTAIGGTTVMPNSLVNKVA